MAADPQSDFPVDPHLTAVAVNYKNPDKAFIADGVLPRDTSLTDRVFTWQKSSDDHEAFRLPETAVGPRGRVNRLEINQSEQSARVEGEGIEIPLSDDDLKKKGAKEQAVERATNIIMLRHEVKVAQLAMTASLYPTAQKVTLTGTDQLNDSAYAGKSVELINDCLSSMLIRGNALAMNHQVWAKLRSRADVVKAVLGNSGDSGLASKDAVARLFGVDEILVGEAWVNTAKPGEAAVMAACWTDSILIFHRDRTASTSGGITLGLTAQYGGRVAMTYHDKDIGLRGGEVVRVGEETKPVIVAPYCGYLISDCLE
jgi:hypothetical protein